MDEMMNRKDMIVMKLLHYFITEKNYTPIILQGAEDEIWLENLTGEYQIIRIVSNYLHNDEQLSFDQFKAKKISNKISKKIFTYHMNILNIYTDLGDNVHLDSVNNKRMDVVSLYLDSDIENDNLLNKKFPDIKDKLTFNEEGVQLFIKITNDINMKNKAEADKADEIFRKKMPVVTYFLIAVNCLCYFIANLFYDYNSVLNDFCLQGDYVRATHEYYRIFTAGFLHVDIIHLLLNMYALYVIGSQLESFLGKTKYSIVYIFSLVIGSLMSMTFTNNPSVGASGAIFGLMGSLLYFGYHYRVYLGTTLKSQIIPLIILNLVYGFLDPKIDNSAHIGGLIGGFLITMALGIKYKSTTSERFNGILITLIFTVFMLYMALGIAR